MKIKRVLGIHAFSVKGTMDKVAEFFRDALGAKITPELSDFSKFGFRAVSAWLGIEEPFHVAVSESVNDELPLGKQHTKLAPTFQIIQFQIENMDEAIAELRAKGIRVSDKILVPTRGFEVDGMQGMYECMIHPKSTFGLLIELMQFDKAPSERE